MDKFHVSELDYAEIARLFFDELVVSYEVKNTSHGDEDFREAVIVELETGNKYVLKLADNSFTFPDKIKMWKRCAEVYRELGYYVPRILTNKAGEFPVVRYKGHDCVAYAEEFAKYSYEDPAARGLASNRYFREILTMTAKIAGLYSNYAEYPSGYCLFDRFAPDDDEEEVLGVALEWKAHAEMLPERFQPQVTRIWNLWMENRNELETVYASLPVSIYQADLNSSNTLVDENGRFMGVFDFNLCGKDVLLNYIFREINWDDDEEELEKMISAVAVLSENYTFSLAEKAAAVKIYRCVKPLWYTKMIRLKKAEGDFEKIQTCLDLTEFALTREIDFFAECTGGKSSEN